jgi:hypothetical protein
MNSSLATEFAVIDAEHAVRKSMVAEIELLRILLRHARGNPATTADRFKIIELARAYPEMAAAYGIVAPRKL